MYDYAFETQNEAHWLEIKVNKWKSGLFIRSEYIPDFIRNYMFTKYGNKCQLCGWGEIHPITGRIPLQIEHIDGDCTNHAETNLQLLCPNCHSLTPTYGALNKGKSTRFNRRLARENDRLGT
jgi:5-methylcytosine-specific restriction endonuclease McrA